ncbi:hypothetical protein [Pseudomonas nunensis]|uniref:hypothetical protein n=1 Tax=Pseudomonas nunensis TaxID=2961896 RepID=UPI0025B1D207|nr:hypothetical protein [Pseudomonas nunensis]MDN3219691.1 hypothetical protein [Pseudomonas nunensis]
MEAPNSNDSHGVEKKRQAFADCTAGFAVGLTRERFAGNEWNGNGGKRTDADMAGVRNRCMGAVMRQSLKADLKDSGAGHSRTITIGLNISGGPVTAR